MHNILNILNNGYDRTEVTAYEALYYVPRGRTDFTSMEEVCLFGCKLSFDLSPGMDGIPNEFYTVAPGFNYE